MNRITSTLFVCFLYFSGCGPSSDDSYSVVALKDSLQAEIMAVHDEVMPKHLELQRMKKEIDAKTQKIQQDSALFYNMKKASELLDSAYHSMNNWMYEYEPMSKEMTREEILDYYKMEREKIDAVKDLMLESLDRAIEILQEEQAHEQ